MSFIFVGSFSTSAASPVEAGDAGAGLVQAGGVGAAADGRGCGVPGVPCCALEAFGQGAEGAGDAKGEGGTSFTGASDVVRLRPKFGHVGGCVLLHQVQADHPRRLLERMIGPRSGFVKFEFND